MNQENSFNIEGVCYSWDPETRILRNTFQPDTHATRPTGVQVVAAIKKWITPESGKYAIMVNGTGAAEIDTGYREVFARLFEDRPGVSIAVYNFPVDLEMIPILFSVATGIPLKGFHTEDEAIVWLRGLGFNI